MTDAKFKQLVNSFLDREISQKDHLLLSREVASSPQRRTEFERYRRLHAAQRQALARLFAANGGETDPLDDAIASGRAGEDEEHGQGEEYRQGGEGRRSGESSADAERRRKAEQLKARAARAWSEVQLLTVERKKRSLLIWQFALAGLALLFAGLALYRQSVHTILGSSNFREESQSLNPESAHLATLREQLRKRQGISVGWISNERGEPVALVGRNDAGGVFVMTSSELPHLSQTQLTTLLSRIPPVGEIALPRQLAQPVSRVGASPRITAGLLPLSASDPFAAQSLPITILTVPKPQEPPKKESPPVRQAVMSVETFWSGNNYHTDIHMIPAAESKLN